MSEHLWKREQLNGICQRLSHNIAVKITEQIVEKFTVLFEE